MKGQLYSASQLSVTQSSSLENMNPTRSYIRPWADPPFSQLYYNWTTSLPKNWKKITPKPVHLLSGTEGSRSTLDFLRETMRYIGQIASPKSGASCRPEAKLHQFRWGNRLKPIAKRTQATPPPSRSCLVPLQRVSFPSRISDTRRIRGEQHHKTVLIPRLFISEPSSPQLIQTLRKEPKTVLDIRMPIDGSPRSDSIQANSIKE